MTFATIPIRSSSYTAITLLVLAGCGDSSSKPDATVQGTVTIDGELVGRGMVTFYPEGSGPVAYGTILKDGTYALRIGQGQKKESNNKILSGKYTATVAVNMPSTASEDDEGGPPKPGARLTDAKFSDKTTSELKYEVKSGRNVINISVDRALPQEEVDSEAEAGSEVEAENLENQAPTTEEPAAEESESPQEQPVEENADSETAPEEPAS